MAWLALDRAGRIAETHRTSQRQLARWRAERDAIAVDINSHGTDHARGVFVRAYDRHDMDAALLVLPLLRMEPVDSPQVRATIDAVRTELSAGGPLLYRYTFGDDGLTGHEGAFLPCSFWLVQALAATGRVDEACETFEQLLGYSSTVGLFAEEIDPAAGRSLGNYPQAFTHATLVQAALAIQDATKDRAATPARYRTRREPAS